ncbi:MAG: hypothetical protein HW421_2908 [Ignavibacteria bacterium]|nr:hypothetical protein [Ignavibacteria bacterium]
MKNKNLCMICGGSAKEGHTTLTVDNGERLVVLRNIPAMVCTNCGEEWIANDTAIRVEESISATKSQKSQVEILAF